MLSDVEIKSSPMFSLCGPNLADAVMIYTDDSQNSPNKLLNIWVTFIQKFVVKLFKK